MNVPCVSIVKLRFNVKVDNHLECRSASDKEVHEAVETSTKEQMLKRNKFPSNVSLDL